MTDVAKEEWRPGAPAVTLVKGALMNGADDSPYSWPLQACGVFSPDGERLAASETWSFAGRLSVDCRVPSRAEARRRPGRWLFGGVVFNHFGHAFIYSASRLWGVDHLNAEGVVPDGVLFFQRAPRLPEDPPHLGKRLAEVLVPYDPGIPVDTVAGAEEVEELYLPTQGISTDPALFVGTPGHHAYMRRRGRAGAPATPDLDLYISRTGTGPYKGNHILENLIERQMAEAGYRIFQPEKATLAEQIAVYQRARRIVGVDGSAFHVAATAIAPECKVAILARRAYYADAMADQVHAFSGADVTVINAYTDVYSTDPSSGTPIQWYRTLVMTDFDLLGRELAAHGFLDRAPNWQLPRAERIAARIGRWSARLGAALVPVPDELRGTEPGLDYVRVSRQPRAD